MNSYLRKLIILLFVLLICYFNANYTSALGLPCSGGHLGGGSWFFYWYLGMISKPLLDYEYRWPGIAFVLNAILFLIWEYIFVFKNCVIYFPPMFHDKQLSRGWMHVLQTVFVLLMIKSGTSYLEKRGGKIWNAISRVFLLIGKNTLYIFLYHILFRDIGRSICSGRNIWEFRICVGILMLFGPLGLAYIETIVQKWFTLNRERIKTDI